MKKLNKKQKVIILISIILIAIIIGLVVSVNVIKINIANGKYNTANSNSSSGNLLPEYIKEGITLGGVTGTLIDLDTSDATATAEDILWGKTAYVNGQKITGTYRTLKMLNIGDYVAYTPDKANNYTISSTYSGASTNQTITQEDLKWRIFNINEDGTVDLISAVPTTSNVVLSGALGYNNGVYFLNDVSSKLYSNKGIGATARSLNIEDIEDHFSEEGKEYVDSYENSKGFSVGELYTLNNKYYPLLYAQEKGSGINTTSVKKDGIEKNDSYYTSPTTQTYSNATTLTVTHTYYLRSMRNVEYFDNGLMTDLIFTGMYWLASRCVNCLNNSIDFCINYVVGGDINGIALYVCDNRTIKDYSLSFRPLVTLKSNIMISSGDGSEQNPYQIKY